MTVTGVTARDLPIDLLLGLFKAEPQNESQNGLSWLVDILDSISDGLLMINKDEVIVFVNSAYCRITGMKKDDFIGQRITRVRPGAFLPSVVSSGQSMRGVLRTHGNVKYVVDMTPIYANGKIVGGVSVARDISEIRNLARELEAQQSVISGLKNKLKGLHQARYGFDDLVGTDAGFLQVLEYAKKAARGDSSVLIAGETGTGKELFAHAIHRASKRAGGPFIPVNCGAIPSNLLESELFGYDEGAFSGSKKGGKPGLIEIAHGGTLFLDEVTELEPGLQTKLLRFLQNRLVRRVGGIVEKPVDVRIISATNCDIEVMVDQHRFRIDLYYRLNIIMLLLPPLREKRKDIPLLAGHFLNKYGASSHIFSREAMDRFLSYNWPGNVRELENAVEVAVQMSEGNQIEIRHLPSAIRRKTSGLNIAPPGAQNKLIPLKEAVKMAEVKAIMQAIESFGSGLKGKKDAAGALGISLATLYNKMNTLNIEV